MTTPEPLRLTLEEAFVMLGERGMTLHWGPDAVTLRGRGVDERTFAEDWPEAVSAALGVPVVRRDDTAELVELLARMTYTARILHQNAPPAGDDAEVLALITAAEAALARVKGGER